MKFGFWLTIPELRTYYQEVPPSSTQNQQKRKRQQMGQFSKLVEAEMTSSANENLPAGATTPTSLDVLCGFGNEMANHLGNKRFYRTVSNYVEHYILADSRKQKMQATKAALDELTISGVRFLKKHRVHQHWYVAGQRVGRDKIGYFFREHLVKRNLGSSNNRRRQRPQCAFRPIAALVRHSTPRSSFLGEGASSGVHRESLSSDRNKLDNLQGTTTLLQAQRGRARTSPVSSFANVPAELTPSNQPSICSPDNCSVPLSPYRIRGMEAITPLSLIEESLDRSKNARKYQRCRQSTSFSFHDAAKYQPTSHETLPSISSFSSTVSSEVRHLISSMHDSSDSDLSEVDLFDDSELAECLDWQLDY